MPLRTRSRCNILINTLHLCCAAVALCLTVNTAHAQQSDPNINPKTEPKVEKDVVYGTVADTKLLLDAYTPQGFTGKRPAVVLIHGGAWAFGDKSFYGPMCEALARKGFAAFTIDYRLMPKFRYPAPLDDSQRAVRWIRAHADTYNVDPERIGALGDSAGGYCAALLGMRDTRDNSDTDLAKYSSRVQCVVDFYGPTNFIVPPTAANQTSTGAQIVIAFLGKKPSEDPALYKESSPITYADKLSAPFLIIHGTGDMLVPLDQSTHLYDALHSAGIDVTLVELYNLPHGFLTPKAPKQNGALAEEFLTRLLKP